MDVLLVLVVAGCAVVGAIWGALRMATAVVGLAAAVLAARYAGPAAVDLLAGGRGATPGLRVAVVVGLGLVVAVLVFLGGRGLRRTVDVLRLSWLDRLGGMALAGAGAAALLAVVLGLAAVGGHPATTPLAGRLATMGRTFLAGQSFSNNSTSPSSTPATPTSRGQQPS